MSRIEKIETEVRQLTAEELSAFRAWFAEYDAEGWDRQIEGDARAGKLDDLAGRALADHRSGRSRKL